MLPAVRHALAGSRTVGAAGEIPTRRRHVPRARCTGGARLELFGGWAPAERRSGAASAETLQVAGGDARGGERDGEVGERTLERAAGTPSKSSVA